MTDVLNGTAPAGIPSESDPAAAQANAATTNPQTDSGEGGEQSPAAEKTFTQKELDEILQKRLSKERRNARREVREVLQEFGALQQPAQSRQAAVEDGKPLRSHFASEDEWLDARDAWRDSQRAAKEQQNKQQERSQKLAKTTEKVWKEALSTPGFDAEVFEELSETVPADQMRELVDAVLELDAPAKVLAHLTANPDELTRIAALSPKRQAAELGKLEAKATAEPVQTSKAPEPISPVGKRASSTATSHPSDDDDMDTWMRKERARLKRG